MTRITVLVLNWNGRAWLAACLGALANQAIDEQFDIWLIDNGSQDGSLDFVRTQFPRVRVVAHTANLGYAAGYNRAIAAVETPFAVLLNNDTVAHTDWLAALCEDLHHHPNAAAIGSKLLFLDRPSVINHAGGQLTTLGAAFDVGLGALDGPEHERPGITGCATGAAMLVRLDAFHGVGGFDERYFAYFEDADLAWRMWLNGYTVRYQPRARVLHAYGGSTGKGRVSEFRIRHCQTNRLLNMVKNLDTLTLVAALPASIGYDLMRLAQYAYSRQPHAARALLRGNLVFQRMLPAALIERKRVQSQRRRSDADLFDLGVLVGVKEAAGEWRRLARMV